MKVFLDDERPTPPGWARVYTVEDAISILKCGMVTHLSLDNDLGVGQQEGYKVVDWIEEQCVVHSFKPPEIIEVHSANPCRAEYMRKVIARIQEGG